MPDVHTIQFDDAGEGWYLPAGHTTHAADVVWLVSALADPGVHAFCVVASVVHQ